MQRGQSTAFEEGVALHAHVGQRGERLQRDRAEQSPRGCMAFVPSTLQTFRTCQPDIRSLNSTSLRTEVRTSILDKCRFTAT